MILINDKIITRKDVAKLAGVSETVVSYVINENRYVKQEKKDLVHSAMKQLNYKPNRFARALKGKSCKHILMLIDQIESEYYGELISNMETYSSNSGYLLSISIISNTKEYVSNIIAWQIDAVIISSMSFSEEFIQDLIDANILVILMKNREYKNVEGAFIINTGLLEATEKSVLYLHENGCKNIAYIDRISKNGHFSNLSDHRFAGYHKGMEKTGLGDNKIIITNCKSMEELQQKVLVNVKEKNIDGIFARNDNLACIALNTLINNGYKVPNDIQIIGIDDSSHAKISIPTLSSLRMQKQQIAKTAIDIITNYYDGNPTISKDELLFEPELVLRDSLKILK